MIIMIIWDDVLYHDIKLYYTLPLPSVYFSGQFVSNVAFLLVSSSDVKVISAWLAEQGVCGLRPDLATTIHRFDMSCFEVAIWLLK